MRQNGAGNGNGRRDAREEIERRGVLEDGDPETQGSDIAEETEEQANQPGRLVATAIIIRDVWRLLRGEDDRGRKVRWLIGLLQALPPSGDPDVRRPGRGDGGGPGPSLPGGCRDRQGHQRRRHHRPRRDRRSLHRLLARLSRRQLRPDLPGRGGRPAGAAGPAAADLPTPAGDVDRLLHPAPPRSADLAYDQRRLGARPARHGRHRHPVPEHADADFDRRHPAAARRAAGAGHVHHLPAVADRQRHLPDHQRRRLPGDAGEDREHHRLSAGDAVGDPGGALVRAGGSAPDRDDAR